MKQVVTALFATTCFLFLTHGAAQAQQMPKTASVGFTNKSEVNVIVIGYTIVNGSKRYGPALQLKKSGDKAFEANVPVGAVRYFTIHDANQPRNILGVAQHPIPGNATFEIVPNPNNPKMLMLVPAQ
jgi:hypothetical protein